MEAKEHTSIPSSTHSQGLWKPAYEGQRFRIPVFRKGSPRYFEPLVNNFQIKRYICGPIKYLEVSGGIERSIDCSNGTVNLYCSYLKFGVTQVQNEWQVCSCA